MAWSDLTKEDFDKDYWNRIWKWYANGGIRRVTAYLAELDISSFDPKAPPPRTPAFWAIVDASQAPEEAELADVFDRLNNPAAVTLGAIAETATEDFREWITDRRNRRSIPHRLEQVGYVPIRNDAAQSGLWVIKGRRQTVYAQARLCVADRLRAARQLQEEKAVPF